MLKGLLSVNQSVVLLPHVWLFT